ncbi:hypothetical protein NDU88_003153 [Pleurodeles waltl]|uniref:Uncharacterized protein n=1 Tax=Pleurodeles waltl TaxID=8319 RepID=A0AAV7MXP4_PLEWA|nr:hypothetical protein NDU88_003153 [Pleurodeles waltl]
MICHIYKALKLDSRVDMEAIRDMWSEDLPLLLTDADLWRVFTQVCEVASNARFKLIPFCYLHCTYLTRPLPPRRNTLIWMPKLRGRTSGLPAYDLGMCKIEELLGQNAERTARDYQAPDRDLNQKLPPKV